MPPPWYHTMTGRLPAPRPGVNTLRVRQSSLSGTASRAPPRPASSGRCLRSGGDCGACPAHVSALRTPAHGSGLRGAMKRARPPVGAPYGTPLKALTPSAATPRILPDVVSAIGASAASVRVVRSAGNSTAAQAATETPERKVRRLMLAARVLAARRRSDSKLHGVMVSSRFDVA